MRIVTIGLGLSILAAAPVLAAEGNPVGGVGVSVESTPGGIVTTFDNAADAKAACTEAGGTYASAQAKTTCSNPRIPLEGKGRGVAVGRGGGAYTPVSPTATPTATATLSGSEKTTTKPPS